MVHLCVEIVNINNFLHLVLRTFTINFWTFVLPVTLLYYEVECGWTTRDPIKCYNVANKMIRISKSWNNTVQIRGSKWLYKIILGISRILRYIYTVQFYLFKHLISCIFVQEHSCFKMVICTVCIPIFWYCIMLLLN